jgi:hypothetical protein
MKKKPQRTFIVPGEGDASQGLARPLRAELGLDNVVILTPPAIFQSVRKNSPRPYLLSRPGMQVEFAGVDISAFLCYMPIIG